MSLKTAIREEGERDSATAFRHSEFFQNKAKRAEFAEAVLQQIGTDKGGKKIPIGANPVPQGKADENKRTGEYMNPIIYNHKKTSKSLLLLIVSIKSSVCSSQRVVKACKVF
jgi:hypothetical protein